MNLPVPTPAQLPDRRIPLCASGELVEAGGAVEFDVLLWRRPARAFALRFEGRVRAYLNRCAHVPVELDWFKGEFFESSKLYLMCSTHGAIYLPESGACAGGPCRGGKLRPIAVREADQRIYWQPDQHIRPPTAGLRDSQMG